MRRMAVLALVVSALSMPSSAAAQTESHFWFASPFIGATFGSDTTRSAPVYGASAGWLGGRVGFEGEVADGGVRELVKCLRELKENCLGVGAGGNVKADHGLEVDARAHVSASQQGNRWM